MGKENATRTTLKGIFKMTFLCLQLYRQLLRLFFFQDTILPSILPFSFSKITSVVISKPISILRLGRGISFTSCPLLQKNLIGCLLCGPMDCSSPRSRVLGISQARILEWVAISFSRGIFSNQGSNLSLLCLLHCRQIFYPRSHLGKPYNIYYIHL